MYQKYSLTYIIIILLLFPFTSRSAILFEESFDDWQTGYSTYHGGPKPPSPWMLGLSPDNFYSSCSEPAPYIGGLGVSESDCAGGTGKCLEMPRASCNPNAYGGTVNYSISGEHGQLNELYIRWYAKFDEGFDKSHSQGFKTLDRIGFRTTSGNSRAMFIDHSTGGPLSQSDWYFQNTVGGSFKPRKVLWNAEDFYNDHQWHHFELRIKLNSQGGVSDGRVTSWLDGVQQYDYNNVEVVDISGTLYFDYIRFGLGNVSDSPWYQNTYRSMWYDEFAIGTSYIGPIDSQGNPPTDPPPTTQPPNTETLLFSESFENSNWGSRGWYDGSAPGLVSSTGYSGNGLQLTWSQGATNPNGAQTVRNKIPATNEFLLEYFVFYGDDWRGNGESIGPHMLHFLSSEDGNYQGMANTHSGLYFEQVTGTSAPYGITPAFATQDNLRVNTSYGTPANNLVSVTENRSANHCNTPASLMNGNPTCYSKSGGGWYSSNRWHTNTTVPKNQWVRIRYHVKMNTFNGGVANFDGVLRIWVNDDLAYENAGMLYAAGAYSDTEWDQLVIAPWIGDGSPVNQTIWIDELSLWTVSSTTGNVPSTPAMFMFASQ